MPGGQRVDPRILDRVPFAFESDVRLRPQRLHDLDLFFGAAAAIVKILVEPDELHLVPTDPDAEAKSATRQDVETGGLFCEEHRLALREDQDMGREVGDVGASGE